MTKKINLFLFFSITLLLISCAAKSTVISAKLPRTYQMDVKSDMGLIYGKIIHNKNFGKNFIVTFRNNNSGKLLSVLVESFSNDTATDIIMEFEAGEWFVHQITAENKTEYNVAEIRGSENKEFIVGKAGITYVGTWTISPTGFETRNDKAEHDEYIRTNYKNVMPSNALISIP